MYFMLGKNSEILGEEDMILGGSQIRFWGIVVRGEYSEDGYGLFFIGFILIINWVLFFFCGYWYLYYF